MATDIADGVDFLATTRIPEVDAIVTNPPSGHCGRTAAAFARHALELMKPRRGLVAMLLRVEFDSAKTRGDLFGDCRQWSKKLVLTKRITWFEPAIAEPLDNFAWFIWNWRHRGPQLTVYCYEEGGR